MLESRDTALLRTATLAVSGHLDDPAYGVSSLARELGMSRRQLQRRLLAITGQSPSELIRSMRMDHARRLLEARAATVSEAAVRCGYRSRSHFAAAFRRAHGVVPSACEAPGAAPNEQTTRHTSEVRSRAVPATRPGGRRQPAENDP